MELEFLLCVRALILVRNRSALSFSVLFTRHPLSYVGAAMEQFDPAFLAAAQESNYIDVDERYPVQVQRNPRLVAVYLRLQLIEMLRSQPTAQANDRLSPIPIFFNLQCHSALPVT